MNFIIFDTHLQQVFYPLTLTRSLCDVRSGILTLRQKWEKYLSCSCGVMTQRYLQPLYACEPTEDTFFINSCIIADKDLAQAVMNLDMSSCLTDKDGGTLIALRTDGRKYNPENFVPQKKVTYNKDYYALKHITDIFKFNGQQIRKDFDLITKSRKSASLSSTNRILCPENVFAEPGVKAEFAVINASEGPVYLGENSSVGENSVIKGPFAMCENAQVKISAKIYDATTLGPYCKVGGEVENTVFFGYSNKAHDGFVGNSIIGHWCNMGADTNTSNLKNNYSPVRLFSIKDNCYISTDEMFCGTVMGDYSKCGINTMFNTGTVVGVCANVARGGFPEKYIPSFSWITQKDNVLYDYDKAVQTACVVQNRRGKTMTQQEKDVLYHIFTQAENNFKSK